LRYGGTLVVAARLGQRYSRGARSLTTGNRTFGFDHRYQICLAQPRRDLQIKLTSQADQRLLIERLQRTRRCVHQLFPFFAKDLDRFSDKALVGV
jgi:hypothetical protein